ncbi:FAD-dependent monooxygenase [Paraburkholderia sp. EG304]|uniref:FAD-dependent monooxygenase n=1 Tax=Paraburkholderia sp. EG304 TaxID=3237015 RepID=UPI00397E821E
MSSENVSPMRDHLPPGTTRVGPTTWTSKFPRQSPVRGKGGVGRVAIAGDAAHIHSPVRAGDEPRHRGHQGLRALRSRLSGEPAGAPRGPRAASPRRT